MSGDQKKEQVKKVLYQYREIKTMCADLQRQINEMDIKMTSVKAINCSGMPRGGCPVTIADMMADKDELISRKSRFEAVARQKREIVISYIDTVHSAKHNNVLYMHFINGMRISDIAKMKNYSDRHVFRIYHEALDMVDLNLNL